MGGCAVTAARHWYMQNGKITFQFPTRAAGRSVITTFPFRKWQHRFKGQFAALRQNEEQPEVQSASWNFFFFFFGKRFLSSIEIQDL